MKVEQTRRLVGCVVDLFIKHPLQVGINIKELVEKLKRPVSDSGIQQFKIVAADNGGTVIFENRELACRFALLDVCVQKALLSAIRTAMHDNQVLVAEFGFSLSSARPIRVRQDTSDKSDRTFGQGTLIFSW